MTEACAVGAAPEPEGRVVTSGTHGRQGTLLARPEELRLQGEEYLSLAQGMLAHAVQLLQGKRPLSAVLGAPLTPLPLNEISIPGSRSPHLTLILNLPASHRELPTPISIGSPGLGAMGMRTSKSRFGATWVTSTA